MIKLIPSVFAADQVVDIGGEVSKDNFFGYSCIGNLIGNTISVAFIIAAIATFAFLVIGGINWLTSGGDKGKVETAQKMISNALIGLAILIASYAITIFVQNVFKINILAPVFPSNI